MPHVRSEAVSAVEYDRDRRWLFVQFTSGAWYAYLDVSPAVYQDLLAAPSKGVYFSQRVRDRYAFVRLWD